MTQKIEIGHEFRTEHGKIFWGFPMNNGKFNNSENECHKMIFILISNIKDSKYFVKT